jgi:hypothetical protein
VSPCVRGVWETFGLVVHIFTTGQPTTDSTAACAVYAEPMRKQNFSGCFLFPLTLVLLPTRNSTSSAGGLRPGLQPFVTDLGFCVIRKGEIIELTWQVHVRWKHGIPETKLWVWTSARSWNRVRHQCYTGIPVQTVCGHSYTSLTRRALKCT